VTGKQHFALQVQFFWHSSTLIMIDLDIIRVSAASDCHSHRDSHGPSLSESGTVTVAGRGRAAFADSVFSTPAVMQIQPVSSYERVGTSLTLLKLNNR
jgi:hypothetical protein